MLTSEQKEPEDNKIFEEALFSNAQHENESMMKTLQHRVDELELQNLELS